MPRETRSSQTTAIQVIVEPISSFYALLSTFPYLPATDILTPPSAGWAPRNIANFRKLGKTDLVVEILKHLPYIRTDDNRKWRLGYDDTIPITYVEVPGSWDGAEHRLAKLEGQADQGFLWNSGIEPHGQRLDKHVLALTNGSMYGAWLLLDTEAGKLSSLYFLRTNFDPN